jgi:N-acetylneuraminic acid mutarotase
LRGVAGFAHGAAEGRLIVGGGTLWQGDHKLTLSTVQTYDPAEDRWREAPAWPRPFSFGAFAVWSDRLVAAGGDTGGSTRADRADGGHPNWSLPRPVAYSGCALLNGKLHILGGTPELGALAHAAPTFLAVDPGSGTVESLPDFPGAPRIHVALAAAGGRIWAFTGGRWDSRVGQLRNTDEAWSYAPESHTWRKLAPFPFSARGVAALALDERYILLAGGYRTVGTAQAMTAACLVYDTREDRYHAAAQLPVPVMLAGLARLGCDVYAIGGEDAPRQRSASVFRASVAALLKL